MKATLLERVTTVLEEVGIPHDVCRGVAGAVLAELDGELRDAERYQWLRENPSRFDGITIVETMAFGEPVLTFLRVGDIDSAVDKARKP